MIATRYFHGGPSGLAIAVLPPSTTGVKGCAEYGAAAVCRPDRVYVTTEEHAALMFAAMAPSHRASVYEVEPQGQIAPDPDCSMPGISWQCESARIIREIPVSDVERSAVLAMVIG